MNTRELEYILAIAKEKSISKAAEKLYVTQPALSLFLTRLESQLGTPLFIRRGLRSHPHLCRERYIQMSRKVLKDYRDFEQELCDISSPAHGPPEGWHLRPHRLLRAAPGDPLFNRTYPNISLHL